MRVRETPHEASMFHEPGFPNLRIVEMEKSRVCFGPPHWPEPLPPRDSRVNLIRLYNILFKVLACGREGSVPCKCMALTRWPGGGVLPPPQVSCGSPSEISALTEIVGEAVREGSETTEASGRRRPGSGALTLIGFCHPRTGRRAVQASARVQRWENGAAGWYPCSHPWGLYPDNNKCTNEYVI